MDVTAIRSRNIAMLVEQFGGPTEFGRRIERDQAQVSQWTSSTNPKPIGGRLARYIETKLGHNRGWLDFPQWEGAEISDSQSLRLDPERIAELATVLAERWKDVPGGFDLRNEKHAAHFVLCYGLYINMKERPVPENTVAFSAALTSPQGATRDERGENVPAAGAAGRKTGKGGKR